MDFSFDKDLTRCISNPPTKKQCKKDLNNVPERLLLEEIGSSISHGIGALLAIFMFVLMLLKSDETLEYISTFVYGISMVIMMSMSCLYHAFGSKTKVKRLFRRFDYSSIYLLIGGTYAPILLLLTGGIVGQVVFVIQWIIIIVGITFVSIFGPGRLKWLHFPLYFIIGWAGAMFVPLFNGENNNLLFWVLLGGLAYTIGMIPFCMTKSKCAHFIWHFFVLMGFVFQWIGIYYNLY